MSKSRKKQRTKNDPTIVIVDGDNLFTSLNLQFDIKVYDLMALIEYIIGNARNLTRIVNSDKRTFGPIILIISEKIDHKAKMEQNFFLGKLKEQSYGQIDILIIKPKMIGGNLVSCTDMDVGVFLGMALGKDNSIIKRIVLISGDSDFKRVFRWSGVPAQKKISLVCVKGTDSSELKKSVLDLKGEVFVISRDRIIKTDSDGSITKKDGQIKGLKEIPQSNLRMISNQWKYSRKKDKKKRSGNKRVGNAVDNSGTSKKKRR